MSNTSKKLKTRSLGRCGKKSYSGTFQKDKKSANLKAFFIFLISLFLLLLLIFLLLSSNWLNIKQIEIKGLDSQKEIQIEAIIYTQQENKNILFSQESLVFFNKNRLLKNLEDFNFLELKIEKKYFGKKIILNIKEREKALIFKENGYFFFIDREANIISYQIDCQNQGLLPENLEKIDNDTDSHKIKEDAKNCLDFNNDYRQESPYLLIDNGGKNKVIESSKKIKLDSEYIDFSLKLYNDLRGDGQFDLNRIFLDDDYNSIKARLNNNIDLYFNFKDDYLEQISRFFTLKREKGAELNAQKYIDLRYGDKIFYY